MELKVLKGQQLIESGLSEEILALDKKNMRPVFEEAGIEFPEEKRRKGFESDPTFIIAFDAQNIAGYLDYLRSWNDPDYIYIGSIQIAERYRHTRLILRLLDTFRTLLTNEDFAGLDTNVQKTNLTAVNMYQKLGFKLEENPGNDKSWRARASKDILRESPVIMLIEKWRARQSSK